MDEIDPFEARLLFGNQLDNLTGAQPTIERVSGFAIKHAGMADNLLDCILEKLDKPQVPPRINLLFVIDAILLSDHRTGATTWTDLIKREAVSIIKAVIPENSGGDANVPQVRKVVSGWKRRGIFDAGIVDTVETLLANRAGGSVGASDMGMKHQEIIKRIEEDRERHKRQKEEFWIRPADETPEEELSAYWETTSDLNEADWQEIANENQEYQQERRLIDVIQRQV
ncbi:hypothetical protein LPJ64_003758 [Coemansia asiatica]|uniref:CID domain-containing protein n=1 Tax=Coemansia asiatica TaxID=1052880 RepID=A0A9W8CHX6_9FUNG|nr:hypothetical protein LPJ64_003758 [Coemansia asiatica]KAJ2885928.1 hypothetical protein FB639_001674 [Coemansia asiatica]